VDGAHAEGVDGGRRRPQRGSVESRPEGERDATSRSVMERNRGVSRCGSAPFPGKNVWQYLRNGALSAPSYNFDYVSGMDKAHLVRSPPSPGLARNVYTDIRPQKEEPP
jgi:hypothetical protein